MKHLKSVIPVIGSLLLVLSSACKNDASRPDANGSLEEPLLEEVAPSKNADDQVDPQDRALDDLIRVAVPQAGATLSSPQEIRGSARGNWFFEGDFAVYLLDENGQEIAVAIAIAQGEWMTTEWVEFEATMEFEVQQTGSGTLVFEKSNPSDNRELDRELRLPVTFGP